LHVPHRHADAVDGHEGLVDWIAAADSALYRANSAGRNRVAGPISERRVLRRLAFRLDA
jgi:hypothetical protein